MNRKFTELLLFGLLVLIFPSLTFGQAKLPASAIKTIYITPLSHYDLGFVEPPDAVRERAARHIDEVIRVAESEPDFKWTIESVWQVEEWLKRQKKPTSVLPSDKPRIARLMNLIKSGRIALSTSWGSMHTDFMGAEELNRLCYEYTQLNKTFGVESQLALLDDVPGHPTSLPSVLGESGTKYLVTGANLFLADATSLAPGKVPFYWESPDGNKVLTWISAGKRGGYVEALTDFYLDPYTLDPYTDRTPFDMFNPEMAGKKKDIEVMEIGVTELLNRYNKAGYNYDAVMAMYAHDFIEPTNVLNLLKAIELWNKKHDEVKLKIATPNEFFKYIEGKYAGKIPTYRGEWSGLWSEAKTRSPRISTLARVTQEYTPAAETLWSALSMTRAVPAPAGNFSRLYDLLYGYDEHSGAGNNGWPQLNSLKPLEDQNLQYVRDMKAASEEAGRMMDKGVNFIAQPTRFDAPKTPAANTRSVVVYNGLSWTRSDLVRLEPPSTDSRIVAVKTSSGTAVAFDTDSDGAIVFVAADVPAMGYATFEVTVAAGKPVPTLTAGGGNAIGNAKFSVRLRADGTVESIRDVAAGREMVNAKGERPFNDLLKLEGPDASVVTYPAASAISVERGRVLSRITIRRDRSIYPVSTITIYNNLDRVDLHNELDPRYEGFVGGNDNWGDTYYFAFPFNVAKENLKLMRGGQKWFDKLPDDYLPGARQDAVTTRHAIGVTDGRSTVVAAHRQSFHWSYSSFVPTKVRSKGAPAEFPAMYTGKFPLPEATLYARALRNASESDTHDKGVVYIDTVEPGLTGNYVYDFAFSASGAFDPVAAWRFGADFNLPLVAKYAQVGPAAASRSYFSVDQPNVQIVDVKPLTESTVHGEVGASPLNPPRSREFVIRLQEFAGRAATVRVTFPAAIKSASMVSLTEDKTIGAVAQVSPLTVSLRAYQTATIKVTVE